MTRSMRIPRSRGRRAGHPASSSQANPPCPPALPPCPLPPQPSATIALAQTSPCASMATAPGVLNSRRICPTYSPHHHSTHPSNAILWPPHWAGHSQPLPAPLAELPSRQSSQPPPFLNWRTISPGTGIPTTIAARSANSYSTHSDPCLSLSSSFRIWLASDITSHNPLILLERSSQSAFAPLPFRKHRPCSHKYHESTPLLSSL